ncbi:hypothetical protein [Epilithonimonas xixisoli]|nr:hypothetical protein [Epilithonimonas xixisoli]
MKKVLFVLIFIISFFSFGQLSPNKQKLIKPLLTIDYAESENIGVGGEYSEIYKSFENIKGKLTNQDLLILALNSSNSLRFYSCVELIHRNDKDVINLYVYYSDYPLKMKYLNGCLASNENISDLIYQEYQNIFDIKKTLELELSKLDKKEIDENSVYKEWQITLDGINKKLTSEFLQNFEQIRKLKKEFDERI